MSGSPYTDPPDQRPSPQGSSSAAAHQQSQSRASWNTAAPAFQPTGHGSPHNIPPYQPTYQPGAPPNALPQYVQGGPPPMHPQPGYAGNYVQGPPNSQYAQPQYPVLYGNFNADALAAAFPNAQPIVAPSGQFIGFAEVGSLPATNQASMNMNVPQQAPSSAYNQQTVPMRQAAPLNSTLPAAPPRPNGQEMRQQPHHNNAPRQQQHRSRSQFGARQNSNGRYGGNITHAQQNVPMRQADRLNSTVPAAPPNSTGHETRQQPQHNNAPRSRSQFNGRQNSNGQHYQFSEAAYRQLRSEDPLNTNVVEENRLLYSYLCGLNRDMLSMQKRLIEVEGQLGLLSLPKTDQFTQTDHSEEVNNSVEPPSQAPVSSASVSDVNHFEDSDVGKEPTNETTCVQESKSAETMPKEEQTTAEDFKAFEQDKVKAANESDNIVEVQTHAENGSVKEMPEVTNTEDVTPTVLPTQENLPKVPYSDVLRVSAASEPKTSSTTKSKASETKFGEPPKKSDTLVSAASEPKTSSTTKSKASETKFGEPPKKLDTFVSPKPTASEPLPQAANKPTDGFEFPRSRKVASSVMKSEQLKTALAQGKAFESRQPVLKKDEVVSPNPMASTPLPQGVGKPTDGVESQESRNGNSPAMSNDQLITAIAQGKATKSLSMVHEKKETPTSTPSKKKNVTPSSGSSKKKNPKSHKPSPASKNQDQEDFDFAQIQQELNEFEQDLMDGLNEYSSVMWQTRKKGKPISKELFHPFFDQIASYLQKPVIFDEPKMSENLSRRISSYSDRNDLKSRKMTILLNLMQNSKSRTVYYDKMFLFGEILNKKEQDSKEEGYLNMILEFDAWKPAHLDAKENPEESSFYSFNRSEFIEKAKGKLNRYSELIAISRIWTAAFVKRFTVHHPLLTSVNGFLRQVDHSDQTLKVRAAEVMQHRTAFLDNSDFPEHQRMCIFYTLLSRMDNSCIRDDILYLFSNVREEHQQFSLESCYYNVIMELENTLPVDQFDTPLVSADFEDFPVKLAKNHLDGFIKHVTVQCKLRNRIGNYEEVCDEMTKLEVIVFKAFEASNGESLSTKECREFLLERKKRLESIQPRTETIKLYITFYDFLIHVDSNIVNYDTFFFKRTTEAEAVVDPHSITDDEKFFVHVFRMLPF